MLLLCAVPGFVDKLKEMTQSPPATRRNRTGLRLDKPGKPEYAVSAIPAVPLYYQCILLPASHVRAAAVLGWYARVRYGQQHPPRSTWRTSLAETFSGPKLDRFTEVS